jgi:ubiquinone/menaquinone biosynthesis C-methylase UbiE
LEPGLSKFWQTLHGTERLALHAAIYTWTAAQLRPGWVLDLGCEYGFGSLLMAEANPGLQVLGADLDLAMLGYSEGLSFKDGFPWVNAGAHELPVASSSLAGVCLMNLLHLVESPDLVLSEVWRVLKPGGLAVLSIPRPASGETAQDTSLCIEWLDALINVLFSEVTYPVKICGQLPSFPPQTFQLGQQASVWLACCHKN